MANLQKSTIVFPFHLVTFLYYVFVSYYSNTLDLHHSDCKYGDNLDKYSWRFMTSWNFMIQAFYFTLCFSEDVLCLADKTSIRRYLKILKNYIFCTFAFPLALTVTSVFWVLYSVNREFVFPKAIDVVFPTWLNHALHTNIVFFVFIELILSFHQYHFPRKYSVLGTVVISVSYYICYFSTYFMDGIWLYPVFEVMTWNQRIIFSLAVFGLLHLFNICGEKLTYQIWGKSVNILKQKYKK